MAVPVVSPSEFAAMSPVKVLPAALLSFLSSFACQGDGTLLRVPKSYHVQSRENARVSKVPCLGAQRRSIFSVAGDRTCGLSLVPRNFKPLA